MQIAVDIGNTSIKLGLFDDAASGWPKSLRVLRIATHDPSTWEKLRELPAERASWFVGSVQREAESQLARWVAHHRSADRYHKLENSDLPLAIEVEFPERVGIDRLLAAVAANASRAADRPAIVIDAGSAVTVDVVSAAGAFQGGIIWPGWQMMAESLAGKTDALPLVAAALADEAPAAIGTSTDKAIRSGLFWGNIGAVREFVARIKQSLTNEPQVFVTGGDAARLAQFACPEATCVPELVLTGIILAARKLVR